MGPASLSSVRPELNPSRDDVFRCGGHQSLRALVPNLWSAMERTRSRT
jgi:hypothetical protein